MTSAKIQEESVNDPVLKQAKSLLESDAWPRRPSPEVKPYWMIRDEVALSCGDFE